MESPKSRPTCASKFRLFGCFKPEFHDEAALPRRRKAKSAEQSFAHIAMPEKQQRHALPRALSSAFMKADEYNASLPRKKVEKEHSNTFRRALMAALNHTPLAKKLSSKKKTSNKKGCYSFAGESPPKTLSHITSSSSSSLGFTPSSLSSSASTNSTTLSTISTATNASCSSTESSLSRALAKMNNRTRVGPKNHEQQKIGQTNRKWYFGNSSIGSSLLLITGLVVLIVWGRCWAIAYTSIGLFVVSNRRGRVFKEGAKCEESSEFGSFRSSRRSLENGD